MAAGLLNRDSRTASFKLSLTRPKVNKSLDRRYSENIELNSRANITVGTRVTAGDDTGCYALAE